MHRRDFLLTAATSAVSASDKATIAIMGVRRRGRSLAGVFAALPDVDIA